MVGWWLVGSNHDRASPGGGKMELDGLGEPASIDETALEVRAGELIAELGRGAMQRMVDEIQHALRLGDESAAAQHQRLLRRIEQKLYA
jgi:hypothetical protein